MPIGTSFKVLHKIQGENCQTMIISDSCGEKIFKWSEDDMAMIREYTIDATFIPIQQPVSFMEVVNQKKRCKVEHRYIDSIRAATNLSSYYITDFRNGKYIPLNYLMTFLGYHLTEEAFRDVINDGEWYLEE